MNICMCGAQAGYPHNVNCPRPLYRGSAADEAKWLKVYEANKADRSGYAPERG
jgi:hypothetical protein